MTFNSGGSHQAPRRVGLSAAVRRARRTVACTLLLTLSLGLVVCASEGSSSVRTTAIPPEVIQAAEQGLGDLLRSIPADDRAKYGFSPELHQSDITLGRYYQVWILDIDSLAAAHFQSLAGAAKPTSMWYVGLIADGQLRTLLTVDRVHGVYRAVAIGSTILAAHLNEVVGGTQADGGASVLLRVPGLQCDFLQANRDETYYWTPIGDTQHILGLECDAFGKLLACPESEILARLESLYDKVRE